MIVVNKVLILAKAYPPNLGGVETYSEEVAKAYFSKGYDVTVVTQHEGAAGFSGNKKGFRVWNVGGGPQIVVLFKILYYLIRSKRDWLFVHATTWRMAIPAILLRLTDVYITVHGREVVMPTGILYGVMRWTLKRATLAVVISRYALTTCLRRLPLLADKSIVSWNGLTYAEEAKAFIRKPGNHKTIQLLTACRLTERKNVSSTLYALSSLKKNGISNFYFSIAGDGPQKPMLERLVCDLGLESNVRFLGRVSRNSLPELYKHMDIFVHPQISSHDWRDFESFCLVVVDAMSFSMATIAGVEGAPVEYIKNGETGILVRGDDITDVADSLEQLIRSKDLILKIGERGQNWALEALGWQRHIQPITEHASSR